jgi:hypothetical protein
MGDTDQLQDIQCGGGGHGELCQKERSKANIQYLTPERCGSA